MGDFISVLSGKTQGRYARLKVLPVAPPKLDTSLTGSGKAIKDLVDISDPALAKAKDLRKLDAYLQIFSKALKIINGTFSGKGWQGVSTYRPQMSQVEVEFYEKTDKSV